MHDAVIEWCTRWAHPDPVLAVDVGGRDVNGHVRHLWPAATWYVIDAQPGAGVDEVANGATWQPIVSVELVLCTEVFEHTPRWPEIIANIAGWLRPGGMFVTTMAGPGRAPHRLGDDDPDQRGWYLNIPVAVLRVVLDEYFGRWQIEQSGTDVRAVAWQEPRIAP